MATASCSPSAAACECAFEKQQQAAARSTCVVALLSLLRLRHLPDAMRPLTFHASRKLQLSSCAGSHACGYSAGPCPLFVSPDSFWQPWCWVSRTQQLLLPRAHICVALSGCITLIRKHSSSLLPSRLALAAAVGLFAYSRVVDFMTR